MDLAKDFIPIDSAALWPTTRLSVLFDPNDLYGKLPLAADMSAIRFANTPDLTPLINQVSRPNTIILSTSSILALQRLAHLNSRHVLSFGCNHFADFNAIRLHRAY
jgi:hypothetical protein